MRPDTVSAVLALRANSSRGGAGGAAAATLEVVGRGVARETSQSPSTPTLSIVGPAHSDGSERWIRWRIRRIDRT